MTILYDLETDGLLIDTTQIHCGVCYIVEEDKYIGFSSRSLKGSSGDIQDMIELLQKADTVVAHNGIKFDNMVIQKLFNVNLTKDKKNIDTLICSKLMYPDASKLDTRRRAMPPRLKGSHSLRAWGYRLKTMKDDYEGGWTTLNQEMFDYCFQDVKVLKSIYNHFLEKGMPPQEAIELEQNFAHIIARQELHGVLFDIKSAEKLHIELEEEKERITKEVHENFKPLPIFTKKNELKNKFKKDGTPTTAYQKHLDKGYYYNKEGVYGVDVITEFNPSSRQHIVYWLKELYGWEPKELTDKGNPIVNEGVLKALPYKEAQVLAHYFNVNKLLGQLALGPQAWLKRVGSDGRIHGQVDTLGAVTRRCTHSKPNMAQVPSPRAFKGKECRQLFIAPKGKKLVGCDASGLELRVLAHYMAKYDGGNYGRTILDGDIHTANQKAAGLPTRNDSKTFIYAFLYGAGGAKIGEIVGGGFKEGEQLKKRFLQRLPALKKLTDAVERAVKTKGTLLAIDGNPYLIRSEHAALNVLLQGAGALMLKYWLIEYDNGLQELGFVPGDDYEFVMNIHDEATVECNEEIADAVAKVAEESFHKITDKLNLRIRLDGEAKISDNWYDIH